MHIFYGLGGCVVCGGLTEGTPFEASSLRIDCSIIRGLVVAVPFYNLTYIDNHLKEGLNIILKSCLKYE